MICHSPYLRSSLLSPSLSWNFYLTKSEAISLSPFLDLLISLDLKTTHIKIQHWYVNPSQFKFTIYLQVSNEKRAIDVFNQEDKIVVALYFFISSTDHDLYF